MYERKSSAAPFFATVAATLRIAVANAWRTLIGAQIGAYRPEAHYMRGPGPKWRAKHIRPEI